MKIEIKTDFSTYTVETEYTLPLPQAVEHMYRLCICAGFSPLETANAFVEQGKEILEAENIQQKPMVLGNTKTTNPSPPSNYGVAKDIFQLNLIELK